MSPMCKPTNIDETNRPREIWNSHVSEYKDCYTVVCKAVYLSTRPHGITFFPCTHMSSLDATIRWCIFVAQHCAVGKAESTDGRTHRRGTSCRPTRGLRGNEDINTRHFLSVILMVVLLYEQEDSSWNYKRWSNKELHKWPSSQNINWIHNHVGDRNFMKI